MKFTISEILIDRCKDHDVLCTFCSQGDRPLVSLFSGGTIGADELTDAADFKKTNKVLFMSAGGRETGMAEGDNSVSKVAEDLKAIGINAHSYISPETAHEWQTWRRSLYQFAQLLFK